MNLIVNYTNAHELRMHESDIYRGGKEIESIYVLAMGAYREDYYNNIEVISTSKRV